MLSVYHVRIYKLHFDFVVADGGDVFVEVLVFFFFVYIVQKFIKA